MCENERLRCCGRRALGNVEVRTKESQAYYTAVAFCGLTWHCPVCAARVAVRRALEIAELLNTHHRLNRCAVFATFTVRHRRSDRIEKTFPVVSNAWGKMVASGTFRRWKEKTGVVGYIRSLEVTPGGMSGSAHPHIHALMLMERPAWASDQEYVDWWFELAEMWRHQVEKLAPELAPALIPGVDCRQVDPRDTETIASYVAKAAGGMAAAQEMTRQDVKEARSGAYDSYFDVADQAAGGDKRAFAMWRAYETTTKGARKVTWSRGLRQMYAMCEEKSDEELAQAKEEKGELVVTLDDEEQTILFAAGDDAMLGLLEAVEAEGYEGYRRFMGQLRLREKRRYARLRELGLKD